MKLRVTQADINRGRLVTKDTCGCPIWHALNRTFNLGLTQVTDTVLTIPDMHEAWLEGIYKLKILLPPEAVEFQRILRAAPQAVVGPKTFNVKLEWGGE
jgi:hypothetical protein